MSIVDRFRGENEGSQVIAPDAIQAENEALKRQLRLLQDRLSVLESTHQQRLEELEQTSSALMLMKRTQSADACLAKVQLQLTEANGWVFKLAGERRRAELEAAAAKKALGAADLRHQAELARFANVYEGIAAKAEQIRRRSARMHDDVLRLTTENNELRTRAEDDKRALLTLQLKREEHAAYHKSALDELAQLQQSHSRSVQYLAEAQGQLHEQNGRINNLERLFAESNSLNARQRDLIGWLQLFVREILQSGKWYHVTPAQRDQRLRARLARLGLFDGGSYLQRYPDVAKEGFDPLSHYLLHGIAEGRQR